MRIAQAKARFRAPQLRTIPLDELIERLERSRATPDITTMLEKARELQRQTRV